MEIWFVKSEQMDIDIILSVGDTMVLKNNRGYKMFIQSANGKRCIEEKKSVKIVNAEPGPNLVFSYQPLIQRKGNVQVLYTLSEIFKNKHIQDYFKTAIDILNNKLDSWDSTTLSAIYSMPPLISDDTKQTQMSFLSYLSFDLKKTILQLVEDGMTKAEAIKVIKKENLPIFLACYRQFKKENPDKKMTEDWTI